jgi:hypothetical protein
MVLIFGHGSLEPSDSMRLTAFQQIFMAMYMSPERHKETWVDHFSGVFAMPS